MQLAAALDALLAGQLAYSDAGGHGAGSDKTTAAVAGDCGSDSESSDGVRLFGRVAVGTPCRVSRRRHQNATQQQQQQQEVPGLHWGVRKRPAWSVRDVIPRFNLAAAASRGGAERQRRLLAALAVDGAALLAAATAPSAGGGGSSSKRARHAERPGSNAVAGVVLEGRRVVPHALRIARLLGRPAPQQ